MKKALKIILNVVVWIFVALAALMTVVSLVAQQNDDGLANLFGRAPVSVLTDSMSGTIEKGDVIFVEVLGNSADRAKVVVNDIITYRADLDGDGEIEKGEINTHRVVAVRDDEGFYYYTTKGDNPVTNPVNDKDEVPYDNVLAKYTGARVGGVGTVINYLRTPTGFLICIVIPLLLFFLYEIYNFIAAIVANRAAKSAAENEEEIKRRAVEEYLAQQTAAEHPAEADEAPAEADEAPAEAPQSTDKAE